jgi:hypothetical protein
MEYLRLIPEHAAAIVDLAVGHLKTQENIELDYSPASIRFVNNMILKWRKKGDTVDQVARPLLLLGMYLGEVIIRNLGGTWVATERLADEIASSAGGAPFLLELLDGRICNPIQRIFHLMKAAPDADLVRFYELVSLPAELAPGQWRPRQAGHPGLHNN